MKYLAFFIAIALCSACTNSEPLVLISTKGANAESVYLTHDQQSNTVVAWTERTGNDLSFSFAVSYDNGQSFSNSVTLPLTSDVATHAEGMPKLAFKKDGTIVAAFEKKAPTEANKYAAAIYYTVSKDGGKSWSSEKFLHSDTAAGRSRSYFDLERLPDGEIGASWLDIKVDVKTGGRSVRFAKTEGDNGFGGEILVDSSACQCCRIDVYSDLTGRVNVAYRGLATGVMGQPIRDMMIATSDDNGKRFTRPMKISQDNWTIDGCPHNGPSLCSSKGGLYSFWYTEGNGTGIFYSFKKNGESTFRNRESVSNFGRSPQLSADDTRLIMVWEENTRTSGKNFKNIFYRVSDGNKTTRACLTPNDVNASSPVVAQTNDGFVVAFLMETPAGTGIHIAKL